MMVTQSVLRCLGDPIRSSILELLAGSRLTVSEIAANFDVSRPAVSRHLRVMRSAGVVSESRSGRERIYRLEPEMLESAAVWLRSVAAARPEVARLPGEPDGPPTAALRTPESDDGSDWRQW